MSSKPIVVVVVVVVAVVEPDELAVQTNKHPYLEGNRQCISRVLWPGNPIPVPG